MITIGLDLGTNCGFAVLKDGEYVESGTWNLKPNKMESPGMRYIRFKNKLSLLLDKYNTETERPFVAYELVRRHMGVEAAHIYGGLQAQMMTVVEESDVLYSGLGVTTIKKRAVGKGKASKEDMIKSASEEFDKQDIVDDNEADALWIAKLAYELLENGTI